MQASFSKKWAELYNTLMVADPYHKKTYLCHVSAQPMQHCRFRDLNRLFRPISRYLQCNLRLRFNSTLLHFTTISPVTNSIHFINNNMSVNIRTIPVQLALMLCSPTKYGFSIDSV